MKSLHFSLILAFSASGILAERLTLPLPADPSLNNLFNPLQNTAQAIHNLVTTLLGNQTGIFSGNCSVFFRDSIDYAACDIESARAQNLVPGTQNLGKKPLPEAFVNQLALTNIVLADIYAEWSKTSHRGKYTTSSYNLGDNPCTDSLSETPSLTADASRSLSPTTDQTRSFSASDDVSRSNTLTPPPSLSHTPAEEQSASFSHTGDNSESASSSQSLTETSATDSPSWPESISRTLSRTLSHTKTFLESLSSTHSDSTSHTGEDSETASRSQSESATDDQTLSASRTKQLFTGSEWALWDYTTGVYNDTTSQAGRFTSSSGVVIDSYTGLQWQSTGSGSTYTWSSTAAAGSAQDYCKQQTTGGYNDWRLPTRAELGTLIDYTQANPSINTTAFPATLSNRFWTKTAYASDPTNAWTLVFTSGMTDPAALGNTYYGRCVRFNATPVSHGYTDENDSTLTGGSTQVKDIATGLIWQREISPTTHTRASAISYCSGLTLGGYSWRLPTIRELSTLMDLSKTSAPTIDTSAFPNMPTNFLWASTPYQLDPSNTGWNAYFNTGSITQNSLTATDYVRCVRQ